MPLKTNWVNGEIYGATDTNAVAAQVNTNTASLAAAGVDPRAYGVTFNGTTDDTIAWNAMSAALVAGDLVILPTNKTSLISSNIIFDTPVTDLTILGRGSRLKLAGTATAGTTMVQLAGARSTVQGLRIEGHTSVAGATGIRPRGDQQTITGCDFKDCEAGGIYFQEGFFGTKISLNNFRGAGYGICTHDDATTHHLTITDNSFEGGTKGDAIEINTPTGGASDITITGNVIRNYTDSSTARGMGIGIAKVNRFTIADNIITGCALDGIHIEDDSADFSISNNTIKSCGRSGISLQIGIGAGAAPHRFSITGNSVLQCCTSSGTGGIALEGATPIANGAVIANTVSGCGHTGASVNVCGIELGTGNTRLKVIGNDVSNTTGTYTAGIVCEALTNSQIIGNTVCDTQGTKTQQYGLYVKGICTDISILGNNLNGNQFGPTDESALSTASFDYSKQNNWPTSVNNPAEAITHAGAITTDAGWVAVFGNAFPNAGQWYYDTTNNKMVIRVGTNSYKTATFT